VGRKQKHRPWCAKDVCGVKEKKEIGCFDPEHWGEHTNGVHQKGNECRKAIQLPSRVGGCGEKQRTEGRRGRIRKVEGGIGRTVAFFRQVKGGGMIGTVKKCSKRGESRGKGAKKKRFVNSRWLKPSLAHGRN